MLMSFKKTRRALAALALLLFTVTLFLPTDSAKGQGVGVGTAITYGSPAAVAAGGGASAVQASPFFRLKADDPSNVIVQTDENFATTDVIVADSRIVLPDLDYEERTTWTVVGGTRVWFESTGTLPDPLAEDTPYYLVPHASGGYEIYPQTEAGDYVNLPNMLAEETPLPAQNYSQKRNKIVLTDQGTGTHRVFSNPLIKELPNVVTGQDYAGKVVTPTADRHKTYEQIIDEDGRKAILSRLLTRNPEMTGSYAISGLNAEFSGDRIPFQSKLRSQRSVVVSAVLRWGETTTRGVAKTPILPADVNTTTGVMTYDGDGNHQVITARKVKLRPFPGGTLPAGLDDTTTYFGRNRTTTTVSLHPTASDATNNTNVIIPSDQGTEGFTIVDYARPGDGERMRFIAEVRQPATGGNTATVRSNSEGWGDGNIIMETDMVVSGAANGRIGVVGRTVDDIVPTTSDVHEVEVFWPAGATPPTLSPSGAMAQGTYWLTRDPGGSVYTRLHASEADAIASLGLSNTDATCLKFTAAGEGYMTIRSKSGRPVSVSSERSGGALAPNFWSPNVGTTEVLTWVVDYNNPDADVIQTWIYRNGILEAIAEGSGTKGLTDSATNAADTGLTFLNSPQGHVPFEGYIYDFALFASTEAIRGENLTAWHNALLSEYAITPNDFEPYNIFPPTVLGDPINGQSITCETGTWAAYPASEYTYKWTRDTEDISGATSKSYVVTLDDVGSDLSCTEIATNSQGSAQASSSSVVGSPSASAPVNLVLPSISGPPVDAKTITANPGTWSGVPAPSYAYQWIRDGVDISGETGSTFSPLTEAGNTITVRVAATNASGSANATSGGVVILPEGSFTPPDNPDLAVWYDASDLGSITQSGSLVSQFNDKSGNSNHATQSDDALKPTSGSRTINSLNAIEFIAAGDELVMPPATEPLGRNSSTVFVVGSFDTSGTAPAGRHFFRGFSASGGDRYNIQVASSNFSARAGSASSISTAFDTSVHIFAIRRNVGTVEFWIDGTLIGSQTGSTNTVIDEMVLGKFHDGIIGEAIFLGAAASDAQMNELGNYLEAKWAQTWSDI